MSDIIPWRRSSRGIGFDENDTGTGEDCVWDVIEIRVCR